MFWGELILESSLKKKQSGREGLSWQSAARVTWRFRFLKSGYKEKFQIKKTEREGGTYGTRTIGF